MKIIRHITLLLFIFSLHSSVVHTQGTSVDSLRKVLETQQDDTNKINTLNAISRILIITNDYEKVDEYVNRALALAEKLDFKRGEAIAYRYKGVASDTFEKLLHYFDLSIRAAKESGDLSLIYLNYLIKGQYCRSNERYPEALHSFLEALKTAELMNDKSNIGLAYLELGNVYAALGNSLELLKNYTNAIKLFNELKAFKDVAGCYLGIGVDYFNKTNYSIALFNLKQGLTNLEKLNQKNISAFTSVDIRGYILLNIGRSYEMLDTLEKNNEKAREHYDEAEKNYQEAKLLGDNNINVPLLPEVYISLGSLYLKKKKMPESKVYLDKALQLFDQRGSKERLKEIYLKFSLYDSAIGNYKKAYEDYKIYMQYFKEIQNDSNIQKTSQLQNQYEYDKKETLAKIDQAKKDAQTKRTRNLQYTAIGVVLLIAIFLYLNNRQKQRSKNKIEQAYSELKSTQTQLIQSEKMASLGELTAGIAHEIQNPLNFVNNFSEVNRELVDELKGELLSGNMQLATEIANDIKANEEKINHHGKRADAIVKGMLQHSRTSSGQKESTDINALADEYLRLAYHGHRAKDKSFNVTTKTDFDPGIGKINIIPQDIGRVILNLINNAFYAVSEKGKNAFTSSAVNGYEPTVSVSTKKNNSKVEIKVADNGNGIPQRVLDKIFQPFFTTKPTGQGTGLGLSLSYDIVKAHGGEIQVETKQREGAEFTIILPIRPTPET